MGEIFLIRRIENYYCGYDDEGNLFIIKTLCRVINGEICRQFGYDCFAKCPVESKDETYESFIKCKILKNYDRFFEGLFLYTVRKFTEIMLYFCSNSEKFLSIRVSSVGYNLAVNTIVLLALEQRIKEACQLVLFSPHRSLSQEIVWVPTHRVKYISHAVILNTLKRPHNLSMHPVQFPFKKVAQFRKIETVDNYENRVIKFILSYILDNLRKDFNRFKEVGPAIEVSRIRNFAGWIEDMLNSNFWIDVGIEPPYNVYSQVLLKKVGYRELVRIYYLLQRTVVPGFLSAVFDRVLRLKRMDRLWEYYCFTVILDSLRMMGYRIINAVRFEEVVHGEEAYEYAEIELDSSGRLSLSFQKTLKDKDRELRPDFILKIDDKKLVLDAKFRVSKNLYPCELEKYLRKHGNQEELADSCLGLTIRDESWDRNWTYRAITYGSFSDDDLYNGGKVEDDDRLDSNAENMSKVIERFLINRTDEFRSKLGYVPLEIPMV